MRGRPIFLENFLFLFEETVFYNFFQTLIRMEVAFRSSEIPFFKEYFIQTDVRLITNFALLFGAFFCWWTQFLKLGVNQFSSIFLFLTAEAVFPASRNGFLSNTSFRRLETDSLLSVLLFRANFVLVQTIIQNKVEPFFIE